MFMTWKLIWTLNSLWQRKKEKKDELHFFTKSQKYLKPKKYVKIKFLSDAFTTESLQKCVVANAPIKKHTVRAKGWANYTKTVKFIDTLFWIGSEYIDFDGEISWRDIG